MARKLPSFPFYPGDWRKDADLSRCSHAAKGVWIDMLCLAFDCEERGVFATAGVPWTLEEIACAVGGDKAVTLSCVRELIDKGVAKTGKSGALLSRRLVRDEENRQKDAKRKAASRSAVLSGSCPVSVTTLSEEESEKKILKEPEGIEGGSGETGEPARADRGGFAAFWEAYPVKEKELEAHRAWGALLPDAKLEAEIMQGLERHKVSERWQNPRFIPFAVNWLNGRRWGEAVNGREDMAAKVGKLLAEKGLKP